MPKLSQKERLKRYLNRYGKINRLQGWNELGILELPARVVELKASGFPIKKRTLPVINRFGETIRVAEWSRAR